ncbi:hypothetical protein FGO68_gene17655 [Halteria grandinella]|uniref:Uncharacterized protein n=1 Tax=Halteria grandinella TaxID=5974 RepID=A0A8J8NMI0_HALGN|nr:hypothetical protein FGO68_gene17655 [Halteria grandinella]
MIGGGYGGGYAQQQQQQPPQYEKAYPGATDDRTSVKVHAPPGGKSNFTIGGGFADGADENTFGSKRRQVPPPTVFKQQDMNHADFGGFGHQNQLYQQQPQPQPMYQGGAPQSQPYYQPPQQHFQSHYNQQPQQFGKPSSGFGVPKHEQLFGQRVESGNNCGPTTDKSSVKLHAPPGGKSSIQLF